MEGNGNELATSAGKRDTFELVPESAIPEGMKAMETMCRYQVKTDALENTCHYRP